MQRSDPYSYQNTLGSYSKVGERAVKNSWGDPAASDCVENACGASDYALKISDHTFKARAHAETMS